MPDEPTFSDFVAFCKKKSYSSMFTFVKMNRDVVRHLSSNRELGTVRWTLKLRSKWRKRFWRLWCVWSSRYSWCDVHLQIWESWVQISPMFFLINKNWKFLYLVTSKSNGDLPSYTIVVQGIFPVIFPMMSVTHRQEMHSMVYCI